MLMEDGEVLEYPGWAMTGRLGQNIVENTWEEVIPLPKGAVLALLPERRPIGINSATGKFSVATRRFVFTLNEGQSI